MSFFMGGRGGNSRTYHLVKSVIGVLVAVLLVVLGLQELNGRGWPLLLIAAAIVVATLLRWIVFRQKP